MKIALVGSAPSSNLLAPFHDPAWQIWACSPDNIRILPRVDLWFELHGDLGWVKYQHWAVPYLAWMNEQTCPVFAQDQTFIPRAMTFPKAEMIARYGVYFFTSTFSWMIAYAISQGATEIGLFGIDMATDSEYGKQRPGFQHFLNLAAGMGIKISAPNESDILQPPPLYGYDITTPFGRKLHVRKDEIAARIEAMEKKRHAFVSEIDWQITHLKGALDDLDYVISIWTGHQDATDDAAHTERRASPANVKRNGACVTPGNIFHPHDPIAEGIPSYE